MDQIAFAQVHRGEFAGASGDHYIGRVLGDYSTGFWAIKLDGTRLYGTWTTPEEAFEVLAMEFAFDRESASSAA